MTSKLQHIVVFYSVKKLATNDWNTFASNISIVRNPSIKWLEKVRKNTRKNSTVKFKATKLYQNKFDIGGVG